MSFGLEQKMTLEKQRLVVQSAAYASLVYMLIDHVLTSGLNIAGPSVDMMMWHLTAKLYLSFFIVGTSRVMMSVKRKENRLAWIPWSLFLILSPLWIHVGFRYFLAVGSGLP